MNKTLVLRKIKSLLTNEMVYVTSDILVKAIAFLTLPLFINVMSPEDFGEFSLYQTYGSFFTIFFGLNIASGIVKYYIDYENQQKFLTTAIWLLLGFSLFFSALLILGDYFFNIFNIPSSALYIICIFATFRGLLNIGLENIRAMLKASLYGAISLLSTIMSTILGLLLVYNLGDNLGFWRMLSIVITTVFVGIAVITLIIKRDGFFTFKKDTAKYLLLYSLPLIPYSLSSTIISQINRFFLADIGLSEVGVYTFAWNLATIINIIAISLNRAYQPYLFKALRDGINYKNRMITNMLLFYVLYLCFIFSSDLVIWIFGNEQYYGAISVIPVLVLGYGVFYLYSLSVNFFYFYKKNMVISFLSMISAGLIILFNSILIPLYSYNGAAWASVIAYFFLFVLSNLYLRIKLNIKTLSIRAFAVLIVMLVIPVMIKLYLL